MNRLLYFSILICVPTLLKAQTQPLNSAELALGLQKLSVRASVLYIAAHPDDENTRLLAYLSKELKVRTGYLSLTRGDGGQNLIGNEQAELLGLIRTQELLAARKIDGAEQFFTRANDFGFSKTSEESLKIWGKDKILADAVWIIRKFRPDIIITRFPEDSRAGHGQHSASAIIAREAFLAAADPNRFPEQLKHVSIWRAKRIVWNTFNFGGNNTTAPDQLKLDVGLYNPLLGRSYGEIAAISRTNHKSQGFGSTLQRGEAFEFFSHIAGEPAKTSLFEGISLKIADDQVEALLNDIRKNFNVNAPWASVQDLIKLRKLTQDKDFNHNLLDQLILASIGFYSESITREPYYIVSDTISIERNVIYRANVDSKLAVALIKDSQPTFLASNKMLSEKVIWQDKNLMVTQPYWLTQDHGIGQYTIENLNDVGHPENPKKLSEKLMISINGELFTIENQIRYKLTDPAKGEIYQPVVIAPRVTATLSEKVYIFKDNSPKNITLAIKSFANNSEGYARLQLPKGWLSIPERIEFNLPKKGDQQTLTFSVTPGETSGTIVAEVNANGVKSDNGLKFIAYEHIPNITFFPKASARVEKLALKTVGKRIAYIDGAGDLSADAIKEMGYEVTRLSSDKALNTDLSHFDAVVTGVRLYNISDEIKTLHTKLMKYVEAGGTLLVQYNVNTGLKTPNLGPYPFRLSNKRVTEEDSKVNFVASTNAALNYPNKISNKDFEGWVQERGIYFPTDVDPRYTTIISIADKNETDSDSSILIADYGKGKYVYTSLVFFRELPAGVPGAYRLLANLLAPKQP